MPNNDILSQPHDRPRQLVFGTTPARTRPTLRFNETPGTSLAVSPTTSSPDWSPIHSPSPAPRYFPSNLSRRANARQSPLSGLAKTTENLTFGRSSDGITSVKNDSTAATSAAARLSNGRKGLKVGPQPTSATNKTPVILAAMKEMLKKLSAIQRDDCLATLKRVKQRAELAGLEKGVCEKKCWDFELHMVELAEINLAIGELTRVTVNAELECNHIQNNAIDTEKKMQNQEEEIRMKQKELRELKEHCRLLETEAQEREAEAIKALAAIRKNEWNRENGLRKAVWIGAFVGLVLFVPDMLAVALAVHIFN